MPLHARSRILPLALCGLVLSALQGVAWAQFDDGPDDGPDGGASHWGLGAGYGVQQRAYEGARNKKRVLPLLFFENQWLKVGGPGIDLKLPHSGPLSFALRASYSFDGYKSGDSPLLAGMADRKAGFWLGPVAQWHDPLADLSFELLGDVSGHSQGVRAKLALEHEWRFGRFELRPGVALNWLDSKYVDYYYGVRAQEVTAARAQYDGKAALEPEIGLRASFAFDRQQALFLEIGTTWLGAKVTDSPLVDRNTVSGASLGYAYRF